MKKLFILFFFFSIFPSFCVSAASGDADADGDTNVDDLGRSTSGYLYMEYHDSSNNAMRFRFNVFTVDDGYVYLVSDKKNWNDGSSVIFSAAGSGSLRYCDKSFSESDKEEDKFVFSPGDYLYSLDQYKTLSDSPSYLNQYDYYSDTDSYKIQCTVPVFYKDDLESISKYRETGDYSGALNKDDVDSANSQVDDSIELPRGLKVVKGYATGLSSAYSLDKDCVFEWSQTVDTSDYVYDIDAQMVIGTVTHSGSAVLTGDKYGSDWVSIADSYHYDGAQQITRSITSSQLNDILLEKCFDNYIAATHKKLTYKGYLVSQLKIRVRNRSGSSASDYVVIIIDMDSASTTAKVENEDGEDVENDEYNGQDVSDPDKPSVTDSDLSLTGILDYIRSGFGLLGSGGLLSLMSSTFSYIPSSVWTLIKTAIAISITIMVLSLVKRFVFG